ncbi:MAG TPA: ABC transporter ATP-binding protein [Opitutaceae bacterium]|nr:ABC transporter ATP-binding protein [Opitutaceae bacterium]
MIQTRPAFVKFKSVQKRYGQGSIILDDISLDVEKGEFVSLIGPSGCGKSTLLKLISSLSPVTQGELLVDGITPDNAREEMAFIFQEATLLPWRTVTHNIELPLEIRGMAPAKREQIAAKMRGLVGLDHVPDHYPRQLSGGMKMRVSIARALSLSPKILLLDEPFGALDEMTRDRLNEELLAIREQQKFTAFFVTHSVAEAVFLSSRVIVLSANPGRIYKDVPINFSYPRTVETRESQEFQSAVTEVSRILRAVNPNHP